MLSGQPKYIFADKAKLAMKAWTALYTTFINATPWT
jgi:hypothetical protein